MKCSSCDNEVLVVLVATGECAGCTRMRWTKDNYEIVLRLEALLSQALPFVQRIAEEGSLPSAKARELYVDIEKAIETTTNYQQGTLF